MTRALFVLLAIAVAACGGPAPSCRRVVLEHQVTDAGVELETSFDDCDVPNRGP